MNHDTGQSEVKGQSHAANYSIPRHLRYLETALVGPSLDDADPNFPCTFQLPIVGNSYDLSCEIKQAVTHEKRRIMV